MQTSTFRNRVSTHVMTLLGCLTAVTFGFQVLAEDRPNIVIVLADDLGFGDVRRLNAESEIPTPHLDRLAAQGMTFTDAHSPSAVCTPTRYGLITGTYCWRSRLKSGVLNGYGAPLIDEGTPTIGSLATEAGYHTGIVGKWHLGLGFQRSGTEWQWDRPLSHSPKTLGFAYSYVIPASLDFPPYVYIQDGAVTSVPNREQSEVKFPRFLRRGEVGGDFDFAECLDNLTQHACDYIREQSKRPEPFLLYFPLTAPHKPVWPHPRFEGKTSKGPYGDFVHQVDWTLGQICSTLDETSAAKNTLVIFTSDNGSFMYRESDPNAPDHVSDSTLQKFRPEHHRANGPLRGTKADIWEAGHRVPYFARWPGRIQPDSQCAETICHTDLYATIADVVGQEMPNATVGAADSHSLVALFTQQPGASRGAPVIHHSANGMFAIRSGQWKLVLGNGSGGRARPRGQRFARPYHLFDLSADLSESTNLIERTPNVASRLERECLEIIASGRSR